MITVNITRYKERCRKFAEDSVDSSAKVWGNGRITRARLVEDVYVGKLGEFAAYEHISKYQSNLTKPDLEVYSARQKSFSADLSSKYSNFHCKTQSMESAHKYGISWIFQYEENGRKDPMLKNPGPKDQAVLMLMVDDNTVEIKVIMPVELMTAMELFEEPKSSFFVGKKKAAYWNTIEQHIGDGL
jgi:hypothetical protein